MGIGEAMALGSAATWAVGVILARQLGVHLPPLALNLLKNGLVLAVLAPVALVLHAGAWPSLPATELAIVVASGVIGIALADTLYFRALNELGVRSWFAGLRRSQSASRANIEFLELRNGRWKLHPIADWDDIDVATYALQHDLPEHPLSRQGYVSVGDVHTTAPLRDGDAAKTRFYGLTRECGLHFDTQDSVAA